MQTGSTGDAFGGEEHSLLELAVLDLVAGNDTPLGQAYVALALTRDDDNASAEDLEVDRLPCSEELLRVVPLVAQALKVDYLRASEMIQNHLKSRNHWLDDPDLEVLEVQRRYVQAKAERDAAIRANWRRVDKIAELVDLNPTQVQDIIHGREYEGGRRYR